jgi:hypothetical protein
VRRIVTWDYLCLFGVGLATEAELLENYSPIHGPGFRSAAIGPRFRSAAIGPAFRTAAVGPRFRTAAIGPGFRRRGFGFPFVAGVGLGLAATYPYYYSGYYSDPCVVWDGYAWVNVCPYSYYYY